VTTDPAAYKEFERAAFNAVAATYDRWADTSRPFRTALIERARVGAGSSLLDVACGPGLLIFDAISTVGPAGRGVGIDISDKMVEEARRKAARLKLTNTHFQRMDAENLEFPDESFDAVTAGLALLHFPDPLRALSEMKRVLKPGGGVAVSEWGSDSQATIFAAYGRQASSTPVPGPGATHRGSILDLLKSVGFANCRQEEVRTFFEFADREDYFDQMMAFPGRTMAYFRSLPMDVQEEAIEKTRQHLDAEFKQGDLYRVPLANVITWGRKP
jgi:ubiquinone/menaquinone biosynthesis C-methylase UbiE